MVNNLPLISVLMTAYNREKYISEAIESVIRSTFTDWELIITDDHSTDNTLLIARSYEAQDKRIRVYANERNLGDYPNRNWAASYAKGEYIMSVDSDDMLFPNTMAKCVALFEKHKEASFGIYNPLTIPEGVVVNSEAAVHEHFFGKPFLGMGPGGTIIRNRYFKAIGGFPTKYGPANDRYYNLKAASRTATILIHFELVYYRRHEGQEINNNYSYLYNNFRYLRDALNELELPLSKDHVAYLHNKNRRRFVVNILRYALREKDLMKTFGAIKKAEFSYRDAFYGLFH